MTYEGEFAALTNALFRKLEVTGDLTEFDWAAISCVCSQARPVVPRHDLVREGDRPDHVHLILEGLACRYKILPNGRRHIAALLVPGDFCDLQMAFLDGMDYSVATISACTIVEISRANIADLIDNQPRIMRALWRSTLIDQSIQHEWIVNLGARDAEMRLAHLACELLVRMQAVGLATENSYFLPITQCDIAELIGISTVHVNRVVKHLRSEGLIKFQSKRMEIPHVERLKNHCGFNPNYLHVPGFPPLQQRHAADLTVLSLGG